MSAITPGFLQMFNVGMGAISSAASGISQWRAGGEAAKAYEYNARIEERKGAEEREASRVHFTRLLARQRLLYAQAGVDLNSGSPLLVMMDTAMKQISESSKIQKAAGERADLLRYYGRISESSGRTSGLSTFLTGLGRAATDWYELSKG